MSTRTLVELNHDFLRQLRDDPDFILDLIEDLGSSFHNAALNQANHMGMPLDLGGGIRIVHQYHHSTDVTVKTDYAEMKL